MAIVGCSTVYASLNYVVSPKDSILEHFGKPIDSLWYYSEVYEEIESGAVPIVAPDTAFWIDSVYEEVMNPFAGKVPVSMSRPFSDYLVVGTADSFFIEEEGEYTFRVVADDALFLVIDDEILSSGDSVFMYGSISEPLEPSRGIDGIPEASGEYEVTRTLSAGNHTMKFYYYRGAFNSSSRATLYWKTPSSDTFVPIPSTAFPPRVNLGPIEVAIEVGPNMEYCLPTLICDSTSTFSFSFTSGWIEGLPFAARWYFWIGSDSIDYNIIPDDAYYVECSTFTYDTVFECTEESRTVWYAFSVETGGQRRDYPMGTCAPMGIQGTGAASAKNTFLAKGFFRLPAAGVEYYDFLGRKVVRTPEKTGKRSGVGPRGVLLKKDPNGVTKVLGSE
ncbi:MAG: hypothetical protein GF350_14485 [Chitinivibrionales bacterium]|nr:hypothetical protein [Chitinivibrionales bacterium]